MQHPQRVVIVGAGFGGVYTYLNLAKRLSSLPNKTKITIVSPHNYFLFTPLLHEVASGSIHASNIVQPLRQILDHGNAEVVVDKATGIDLANNKLITTKYELEYSYLVIAAGATTRQYNFPLQHVLELKNLQDARHIKNRVIKCLDEADRAIDTKERAALLTFVVIGGGPTGVELAAELHDFIFNTLLRLYPNVSKEEVHLYLVHAGSELVHHFDEKIRQKSRRVLEKKYNLHLLFNSLVENIEDGVVHLRDGKTIFTKTPIMVAGVSPVEIPCTPKIAISPSGQIEVNKFLQLPGYPRVYVIGDMALIKDGNITVPQTAQAAVAEAKITAKNIIAEIKNEPLQAFHYRERGQLVSLGNWNAAGKIGPFGVSGPLAWWIWRTVYATKIIGWTNRVRVVIDWTIGLFYPRDISKW